MVAIDGQGGLGWDGDGTGLMPRNALFFAHCATLLEALTHSTAATNQDVGLLSMGRMGWDGTAMGERPHSMNRSWRFIEELVIPRRGPMP